MEPHQPSVVEQSVIPPVPLISTMEMTENPRIENKKSIRILAQERKRTSAADESFFDSLSIPHKRNVKLWRSRPEEDILKSVQVELTPSYPGSGEAVTFKWVRGELLGKGTYGCVYLALDATTGDVIAARQAKLPRTSGDHDNTQQAAAVQALKCESEILKDLDHPHVVQYLGFEETPISLSIFYEYMVGGSIGNYLLRHGKLNELVTKSFTGQIFHGLEYLHIKGIIHRGLKADNILIEPSGICKIADFGISKKLEVDEIGEGAFTPRQGMVFWMAPEVVDTQKKGYDSKIDIWSTGCVVLEMWTGVRPWNGYEAVAVLFRLARFQQTPPIPEDVILSPLADEFRMKCFAVDPEERPSAAELRNHPYLTLPSDWAFNGFD